MAKREPPVAQPPPNVTLIPSSWEHRLTYHLAIVWLLSGLAREEAMGKRLLNDMLELTTHEPTTDQKTPQAPK